MSYRLPANLHRNRHGTLYFRLSVPLDLRQMVGQGEIYRSLDTSSVRQAADVAQTLRIELWAIFRECRAATMSEGEKTLPAVNIERLQELVRSTKKILKAEARGDELQADKDALLDELARVKAQHRRELAIAIKSKMPGGATATAPAKPTGGKTIKEVWELYRAQMVALGKQGDVKGGWRDEGRADIDHWPHVRDFIERIGGDKPIREVTEDEVIDFHGHVMVTPDIKSAGSRKKKLNRAAALFKFAKTKRLIQDDFADLFKFTGTIKKNSFLKFSTDDLKALFESVAYRECQFDTPSKYWLPVLGLFTGARLNELCQLLKTDIGRHGEIDTISIMDEEENKRLKTEASRRIVPIHSKLIELGFLEFVKSAPAGRLFPHLREDPLKPGSYIAKATEDFTSYRRTVGVGNKEGEGKSRKAFHSFRSTFIDAMRHAKPEPVPEERRTRLVGHEYDGTHNTSYDGGDARDMFPIETLKADVERVQFDVAFTPYGLRYVS